VCVFGEVVVVVFVSWYRLHDRTFSNSGP